MTSQKSRPWSGHWRARAAETTSSSPRLRTIMRPWARERLLAGLAQLFGRRLAQTEKFTLFPASAWVRGKTSSKDILTKLTPGAGRDLTDRAVLRPFPQRLEGDATRSRRALDTLPGGT